MFITNYRPDEVVCELTTSQEREMTAAFPSITKCTVLLQSQGPSETNVWSNVLQQSAMEEVLQKEHFVAHAN